MRVTFMRARYRSPPMGSPVDPRTRVVLVVLDAFPPRHLSPMGTPTLWELSAASRARWGHGWCGMTAMTYSSHASILTGAPGEVHGVPMNEALVGGRRTKLTRGHLRAPTVFGALEGAGRRTAAVCGDQHIAQLVLTEGVATSVWPSGGIHGEATPTNGVGDAFDDDVMDEALRVLAHLDPDFLFVHLNDTDFWGHVHGPEHEEAAARRARADRHVARLAEALAASPRWPATTLVVLSDHDMLAVAPGARVDLAAALDDGATVVADGGAATVWFSDGDAARLADARDAVLGLPGVAEAWYPQPRAGLDEAVTVGAARPDWGCASPLLGDLLVVCDETHAFREPHGFDLPGVHGQPAARAALAVMAGPGARAGDGPWPTVLDWAPTVCALFGVDAPAASAGRVLVEG
jgi:hypothetical protein